MGCWAPYTTNLNNQVSFVMHQPQQQPGELHVIHQTNLNNSQVSYTSFTNLNNQISLYGHV